MKLSPRTVLINFRVSEEFKESAEAAARRDNRSLTSYLEKLVLDDLGETGDQFEEPRSRRKRK